MKSSLKAKQWDEVLQRAVVRKDAMFRKLFRVWPWERALQSPPEAPAQQRPGERALQDEEDIGHSEALAGNKCSVFGNWGQFSVTGSWSTQVSLADHGKQSGLYCGNSVRQTVEGRAVGSFPLGKDTLVVVWRADHARARTDPGTPCGRPWKQPSEEQQWASCYKMRTDVGNLRRRDLEKLLKTLKHKRTWGGK